MATRSLAGFCNVMVRDIQLGSAIHQVRMKGCGWRVVSVLSSPWAMWLASIEVGCNRCIVDEVEASLRVRLMLRWYNHIVGIPPEGLNNGTFWYVACIRIVMLLREGWILPSTRTETVEGAVRNRSSSRGVVVSGEERGRTLGLALSRHRVGPKNLTDLK